MRSPERVGTIQWISALYPDHANQKRPPVNAIPPAITGGRRHSGMGTLLFVASFLLYDGCKSTIITPAESMPMIIPKKGRPPTPRLKP